jgi:hypothetical protein
MIGAASSFQTPASRSNSATSGPIAARQENFIAAPRALMESIRSTIAPHRENS